ncbi:MAG TPA: hypothetical protein VLA58_00090, partial [Chitinophagaceae bacterium]|nr:hypothetical protein [Chitinophagaceae bacterium]
MKKGFHLLFFLCLSLSISAQTGTELIKVTDLLKINAIGGISLTEDGKKIAYVVTSVVQDDKTPEEYNYQSQIWIANSDGTGTPRQVTFSKEGASQPAWSPDGSSLAFVRSVDGNPQIFLLYLNGGEPSQLTNMKRGASSPLWSPDGKQVAFTTSFSLKEYVNDTLYNRNGDLPVFPMEKPGLSNEYLKKSKAKADPDGSMDEVRAYLAKNETDRKAKVINKLNFQQESTTSSESLLTHVFI